MKQITNYSTYLIPDQKRQIADGVDICTNRVKNTRTIIAHPYLISVIKRTADGWNVGIIYAEIEARKHMSRPFNHATIGAP